MRETIEDVLKGLIAKQTHLDPSVITAEFCIVRTGRDVARPGRDHYDDRRQVRRDHTGGCGRGLEQLELLRNDSRCGLLVG